MKFIVQKMTGLDETTVVELETLANVADVDMKAAYEVLDSRLKQTNARIVEAREFISQVKDPQYKYMFTAFLDNFLGLSSQAQPLLRSEHMPPEPPPAPPTLRSVPKKGA